MTLLRWSTPMVVRLALSIGSPCMAPMHNNNHLISGDNKGYASYLFERYKNADPNSPHAFVAAFAQGNEGDVTPNICGPADGCPTGAVQANSSLPSLPVC